MPRALSMSANLGPATSEAVSPAAWAVVSAARLYGTLGNVRVAERDAMEIEEA
jgi:hypothetical protein